MKRLSLIFFVFLLIINIIAGLILSAYPTFNMVLNSCVLVVAIAFSLWLNNAKINTPFRLSLSFLIPTVTLIEFIIGIFSPQQFQDNWGIIAILLLIAFEALLIFTVGNRSKVTKNQ